MKALAIIKYTFTAIGIAMLVVGFFWANITSEFISSAQHTTGEVIELVRERSSSGSSSTSRSSYVYRPRVQFTSHKGEEIQFQSSVGSNPASFYRGEIVEVLYQETDPYNAQINSFSSLWFGPLLVSFIGGIFALFGGGMVLYFRLKAKQELYLRRHGSPVVTKLDSIVENTRITYNNRHPYQIFTQWQNPSTGKIHVFKSNNIWYDPSHYIKNNKITVFIDKNNPNKYLVDLSFLPELSK
ncbi:MAG: DUF3592 domain-containing protein [Halopseudomonas aestusnigri]